MRTNPFESQLERLARTLTEQFGVQVICQGDQAFTDGRQIVLPSLPEPMDESLERMVVGFLDHEMGHVAFSDFKVVEGFSGKHPGHEGLLNVVEDALIERRAMQRWPGVRANLDAMFAQVKDRVAAKLAQSSPFHRFCTAVYLKLSHRSDMLGLEREVVGYGDLLDQFPTVCDTSEAAALAERILDRWLKQHPQPSNPQSTADEPEAKNQQSDDRSSASGGESDDQADAADAASGQEPAEANPQSGDSNAQAKQGESQPQADPPSAGRESPPADAGRLPENGGDDAAEPAAAPAPSQAPAEQQPSSEQAPHGIDEVDTPPDDSSSGHAASGGQGGTLIGEALAEAIAECVAQADTSTEYRVFTKEHDHIDLVPTAGEGEVRQLLATGTDTLRRLRRGLANALRSAEKRWWREDQSRGALSPRTLHRLCMDRPRLDVFRTRSLVQGRSTAVCIVLDASGSMSTRKMAVARDAMRVLLEALGDLKVATDAFTFTTGHAFDLNQAARACGQERTQLRERFSRISNLEIGVIKHFEEPVKAALRRLPSIRGTGLTPLGEAMSVGARRLITRPESRKIMLVLTDGRAGCEGSPQAAAAHAQHMAGKISRAGIELVGVGIKDESVCVIIEDTIVVDELKDLPAQLCKLLGRTLKKGLRHVG